jgi:hypothetical protein
MGVPRSNPNLVLIGLTLWEEKYRFRDFTVFMITARIFFALLMIVFDIILKING